MSALGPSVRLHTQTSGSLKKPKEQRKLGEESILRNSVPHLGLYMVILYILAMLLVGILECL